MAKDDEKLQRATHELPALRRVAMTTALALATALLGLVAATRAAGTFLVPADSGLAGPAIAIAWGLGGALRAAGVTVLAAFHMEPRRLRLCTGIAGAAALVTLLVLALLLRNAHASSLDATRSPAGDGRSGSVVTAPDCTPGGMQQARQLAGEVAGDSAFDASVGTLTFRLQPQGEGWLMSIFGRDGSDLTAVTPPWYGPNPREIYGWHFRNADNTAANDGSVNAPQRLRIFQFEPAIEGTAGFKPSSGDAAIESAGRGWLQVDDMALVDLEPGRRARMTHLKFRACLVWSESAPPAPHHVATEPTADDRERFANCGLRDPYALADWVTPSLLDGDLDGDGVLDSAAPAVRRSDGARGFAVCLAGRNLLPLGFDQPIGPLEPSYLAISETWAVKPRSQLIAYEDAPPLPDLTHDVITVERFEKSSYTIYWQDGAFQARRDYRVVTGE